ncbi:MAG: hypothetical protein Q4D62_05385 [Planctomycetia bacterium]|nr:hypothetical protein [Planctomycetia bacterium]
MELTAVSGFLTRVWGAGIQKIFSAEVLKNILEKLVETMKKLAAKTENLVADWAVHFLKSMIPDDGKMTILSNFIREKFTEELTQTDN